MIKVATNYVKSFNFLDRSHHLEAIIQNYERRAAFYLASGPLRHQGAIKCDTGGPRGPGLGVGWPSPEQSAVGDGGAWGWGSPETPDWDFTVSGHWVQLARDVLHQGSQMGYLRTSKGSIHCYVALGFILVVIAVVRMIHS